MSPDPSAPSASPTSNPTPVPTHGPAATVVSSTDAIHPSPKTSGTLSPLASLPNPCPTTGRSKAQRWNYCSPSSSDGPTSGDWAPPSYRDILLTFGSEASQAPQVATVVVRMPPRITLKAQPRQAPVANAVDEQGWQKVESCRSHKARLKALSAPRRLVLVDLRGRCFNCFSPELRAALYRSRPRCLKCKNLGHRSYTCQSGNAAAPLPALQWQRVIPQLTASQDKPKIAIAATEEGQSDGGTNSSEATGGRKQRQVRQRRSGAPPALGSSAPVESSNGRASVPDGVLSGGAPRCPRRVIDRSAKIARAEDDLRNTLVVSVVSDIAFVSVEVLAVELASRFELPTVIRVPPPQRGRVPASHVYFHRDGLDLSALDEPITEEEVWATVK